MLFKIVMYVHELSFVYRPKDRDEGSEMEDDHEEEFYYTEVELGLHASSPPTLSHRDMARPPHEGRPAFHLLNIQIQL